jgi:hypothetical protein
MVVFTEETEKGESIRFIGGKYTGLKGWLWLGKSNPPKQMYVVVQIGLNDRPIGTRVNKENVAPDRSDNAPTNYVDAAFQQLPEMEKAMRKVCMLLARCSLDGTEAAVQQKFLQEMQRACSHQNSAAASGKSGVSWFHVNYEPDEGLEGTVVSKKETFEMKKD